MAAANGSQRTLDGRLLDQAKQSRMSYSREYKLEVVRAYLETNLYQTVSLVPRPIPSFSMLHAEKLEEGLVREVTCGVS